jgi:voltage-gated potassium channel
MLLTTPAFYLELEGSRGAPQPLLARAAYTLAALMLAATTAASCVAARRRQRDAPAWHALRGHGIEALLGLGLALAAALPPSRDSTFALALRLAVALATLMRLVWRLRHRVERGGTMYLILTAGAVLVLCGFGYWWLEPTTPTFGQGLWLAFVTAATVGYGDVVPTTDASRIFSVFVVLLGLGVLTLTTAAIASAWVESEERRLQRAATRDLHAQIAALRVEIAQLRAAITAAADDRLKAPGDATACAADRRRSASPPARSAGP